MVVKKKKRDPFYLVARIGKEWHTLARILGVDFRCTEQRGSRKKGGVALGMMHPFEEDIATDLESAVASDRLPELLNQYLQSCRGSGDPKEKHSSATFPNLAGFCRWLGCGRGEIDALQNTDPLLYDRICTVLEDEALNSELSASVLTVYLKQRLGYGDTASAKPSVVPGEQLQLVFEHDILQDGS